MHCLSTFHPSFPFQIAKRPYRLNGLRNIGVPFAHTILAFRSIEKGLEKLVLNQQKISDDLDNNWAVVAEAIQTVLRRENFPEPYEASEGTNAG
jgi:adenylosuccinate lyase